MSTEQNKKIAIGLLEDISKGNLDGVFNTMAKDAIWWFPGNFPGLSGKNTNQDVSELFKKLGSLFPEGLKLTIDHAIAEGDFVAVEGQSYGEFSDGKIYQNKYHWLIEIRDGKVQTFKEYTDTLYAKEILLGALMGSS